MEEMHRAGYKEGTWSFQVLLGTILSTPLCVYQLRSSPVPHRYPTGLGSRPVGREVDLAVPLRALHFHFSVDPTNYLASSTYLARITYEIY